MNADLFLATLPLFAWSDRHILPVPLDTSDAAASCQAHASPSPVALPAIPVSSPSDEGVDEGTGGSNFASTCLFLVASLSLLYVLLALITNLIACYNFVVAWNLITRMYHVDLTFVGQRRHPSSRRLRSRRGFDEYDYDHDDDDDDHDNHLPALTPPSMPPSSSGGRHRYGSCCPICLDDLPAPPSSSTFSRLVSACDGGRGCGYRFHRRCLREWLERSDTCPCCRRDLCRDNGDGDIDCDGAPRRPRSWCHDLTVFLGYAPPY